MLGGIHFSTRVNAAPTDLAKMTAGSPALRLSGSPTLRLSGSPALRLSGSPDLLAVETPIGSARSSN